MCSWKDEAGNSCPSVDEVARARQRRLIGLVAAVTAVGLATGAWWAWLRDPYHWVVEARGHLERVLREPEAPRLERCRRAEHRLRQYLASPGRHQMSARALLGAAEGLQAKTIDAGGSRGPFHPAQADTPDLTIAAACLFHCGRWDLADWFIDEAVQRADRGPDTLRWAGRLRYEMGLELHALDHYQELARTVPTDPEPWLKIAQIYERRSEWNVLLDPLRKYLALGPPDAHYYRLHLVGYLIKARQLPEARQEFDKLQAEAPAFVRREALMEARLLHVEGETHAALQILRERGPQRGDDVAAARELEGRILLSHGEFPDAITALQAAIAADAINEESHFLLGTAHARLGEKQKAEACFQTHKRLRQLKKDIYQLERTAGNEPANVDVRTKLAGLCAELGWAELQQQWQHAAEVARTFKTK